MTDKIRSTIFLREHADNRNRGVGGAPLAWAYRFFIENHDGTFSPGFMTKAMAQECRDIAARNPEDVGEHCPDRYRTVERIEPSGFVFGLAVSVALVAGVAIGLMF